MRVRRPFLLFYVYNCIKSNNPHGSETLKSCPLGLMQCLDGESIGSFISMIASIRVCILALKIKLLVPFKASEGISHTSHAVFPACKYLVYHIFNIIALRLCMKQYLEYLNHNWLKHEIKEVFYVRALLVTLFKVILFFPLLSLTLLLHYS